ncbi:MAG: trypsin-like peptidase domain-containing protein [Alphaproteobacteria bacterium]|nr:trypsin-like peptidase domain-containing protein [Alphaproteobacteria bacterium]
MAAAADPAIGRLNHGGYRMRSHCTASLVRPDLAVTAAHCLRRGVDDLHLLLGYAQGDYAEAPPLSGVRVVSVERDQAVLCLAGPAAAVPYPVGAPPRLGEPLTVAGYPAPAVHALTRLDCAVTGLGPGGVFALDCPVRVGASGAPVLRAGAGGPEIVGLIVATSETVSVGYGLDADDLPAPGRDACAGADRKRPPAPRGGEAATGQP